MNEAALTSLVLRVRMRSRSSTSCLKVGLWDEMACQQSFIIMYLREKKHLNLFTQRKRVDEEGRTEELVEVLQALSDPSKLTIVSPRSSSFKICQLNCFMPLEPGVSVSRSKSKQQALSHTISFSYILMTCC